MSCKVQMFVAAFGVDTSVDKSGEVSETVIRVSPLE